MAANGRLDRLGSRRPFELRFVGGPLGHVEAGGLAGKVGALTIRVGQDPGLASTWAPTRRAWSASGSAVFGPTRSTVRWA